MSRTIANYLEILAGFDHGTGSSGGKRCHFRLFLAPQAVLGEERVQGVRFAKTALSGPPFDQRAVVTDDICNLPCQFVLRSVGYRGVAIEGLPFDPRRGLVPHVDGRVVDLGGRQVPGLYAVGWIKRGPTDRKSTRLNSSHRCISYAVFCLKKKKNKRV